jgi:hypothetical protein
MTNLFRTIFGSPEYGGGGLLKDENELLVEKGGTEAELRPT